MRPWRALFCAGWFAGVVTSALVRRWTATPPRPRREPPGPSATGVPPQPAYASVPNEGPAIVVPTVGVPMGQATARAFERVQQAYRDGSAR